MSAASALGLPSGRKVRYARAALGEFPGDTPRGLGRRAPIQAARTLGGDRNRPAGAAR